MLLLSQAQASRILMIFCDKGKGKVETKSSLNDHEECVYAILRCVVLCCVVFLCRVMLYHVMLFYVCCVLLYGSYSIRYGAKEFLPMQLQ
jgi:hypothetical protein